MFHLSEQIDGRIGKVVSESLDSIVKESSYEKCDIVEKLLDGVSTSKTTLILDKAQNKMYKILRGPVLERIEKLIANKDSDKEEYLFLIEFLNLAYKLNFNVQYYLGKLKLFS